MEVFRTKYGMFGSGSFVLSLKKDKKNLTVECTEGRNHFVKKMFTTINYTVEKLHRSSFAGIVPDIPVGAFRKLTQDEIKKLSKL